nr:LCP family protein [uncultured Solibaculum sp.]
MSYQRSHGKKQRSVFASVFLFLATLFGILILLVGGAALYFLVIAPPEQPERLPTSEAETSSVVYQGEGPMTLLLVGTDDSSGSAGSFMLLRLDPEGNAVWVAPLSKDLKTQVGNREDTLSGFYAYGGRMMMRQAVESATGVTIDHYVIMTASSAGEIVDLLGSVTCNVPEEINYVGPDNGFTLALGKGQQALDGSQLIKLVRYQGWSSVDACEYSGQVMCDLLNQHMDEKTVEKATSIFAKAVNKVTTDIGAVDLAKNLPAIRYLCLTNEGDVAKLVSASGKEGEELKNVLGEHFPVEQAVLTDEK